MSEPAGGAAAAPLRPAEQRAPATSVTNSRPIEPLLLFALVVLGGVLLRVPGLSTPITGIRETQSAMIARNILRDGPSGVLAPRVDYGGEKPGYFALEFPLTGALGALVWAALPSLGDAAIKVPSLAFYAIGSVFLFDLLRRRAGARIALLASALFALYPLHAEMSVSPMPDETGLALSTGAIALLDRHLAGGRFATLVAAFALASLALLAKSTYFYVAVPMIALVVAARGWRELVRPSWIALAVLAVAPLVLWLVHAKGINAASELWIGRTVDDTNANWAAQRGRIGYYASAGWYARLGSRLLALATLAGTLLFAAGLVFARGVEGLRGLVYWWLAGIALYCVLLPHHVHSHHYYLLPAAPVAAAAGAAALDAIGRFVRSEGVATLLAVVLLVPVGVEGIPAALASERARREDRVAFGESARRVVPEGDLLVVSAWVLKSFDGSLLYQADRKGWKFTAHTLDESDEADLEELAANRRKRGVLREGKRHVPPSVSTKEALTPERLEELRAKGARFYAYSGPPAEWAADEADLARHLLARYPVVEISPRWIFVDLRLAFADGEFASPPAGAEVAGFTLQGVAPSADPARFPGSVRRWRRVPGDADAIPFGGQLATLPTGAIALEWVRAAAANRP